MAQAKEVLTPEGHQIVDRLLNELHVMRKYQKSYFDGNKGALKQAMYYENQVDNTRKLVQQRFGIDIRESKGNAQQGSIL